MALSRWPACALAALATLSLPVVAQPLYVKDLGPVSGLFGLPSQRPAQALPSGRAGVEVNTAIASHYIDDSLGEERLLLDGETDRLALSVAYGFAGHWEVQLEVPWLRHSGGFLDSTIGGWHDFWGMSDGGRDDVARDLLLYGYQGGDSFLMQDDSAGIGDPTLSLSRQLPVAGDTSLLLTLGYKFGAGDEEEFLGSGADDLYLALRAGGNLGASGAFGWYGQAGYLRSGASDVIAHVQQRDLWFAGLGLQWRFAGDWSLLGQLDAHAAPADSAVKGLGDDSVMLTGGLRWQPSPAWELDFSVVEDIQVGTAPDVTFQLGVRYRPGGRSL